MTTVETRVVNPVNHRGSVDAIDVSETEMVDVAMKREEDNILVDEEIDSDEAIDLESRMLTVALVKSVVDSGAQNAEKKENPSSRYGLRKRRRPGDASDSSEVSETIISPDSASNGVKTPVKANGTRVKQEPIPSSLSYQKDEKIPLHQPLMINHGHATRGTKIKDHPILGKLQLASGNGARPTLANATKPVAPVTKAKTTAARRKAKRQPKGKGPAIKQELLPTSGAVPNPLSQATPQSSKTPRSYASRQAEVSNSTGNTIPCPLPTAVPCPLQPHSAETNTEKKKVTISEPPVQASRPRIFSVDLDPSTFDFADMGGDNMNDRPEQSDVGVTDSGDFPIFQRDRAFSFEFFNFAGDDLLPSAHTSDHLPHPGAHLMDDMVSMHRPRGDSIIFDPVSFQDGGIHEKNALMKTRGSADPVPEPALLSESRNPASTKTSADSRYPSNTMNSQHPLPSSAQRDGASGQIATLPSSLNNGSPSNLNSSPATFQMELLNKDGRIGIYLPEARKARIARFHAKRKMRIWRKRIKYDCRKKLADSRPRIKGRFVKRSDMDGEE